ncbi:DUF6932 family protein [Dyadobacter luticola]|uniref:Uncharacterized protein n=1 Tax=Dyadobacter luticola TaxID=1979387 RepID=A0A5R9L5N4_9BACT|nr:hypothetical protein [Dyadobacter luticola]TLV03657.1 hypothetical protein FEN17_08665 [Dyadobacter luticola]
MKFDIFGNLKPYQIIKSDLKTFEKTFVAPFSESKTRKVLLKNFKNYLSDLENVAGSGFYQWIDGSFITNKLNPNDIDFVTFIDWKVFEKNEKGIDRLRQLRYQKELGMDGYFVAVYPENHKKNILYQADRFQWQFQFGKSRTDKQKGIIQIDF